MVWSRFIRAFRCGGRRRWPCRSDRARREARASRLVQAASWYRHYWGCGLCSTAQAPAMFARLALRAGREGLAPCGLLPARRRRVGIRARGNRWSYGLAACRGRAAGVRGAAAMRVHCARATSELLHCCLALYALVLFSVLVLVRRCKHRDRATMGRRGGGRAAGRLRVFAVCVNISVIFTLRFSFALFYCKTATQRTPCAHPTCAP
jgi:hypothetical protein